MTRMLSTINKKERHRKRLKANRDFETTLNTCHKIYRRLIGDKNHRNYNYLEYND